jgi:hypothetical protein
MKSCPTCNRTYADETLSFCLVDGSVLSAPYDHKTPPPNPAQRNSEPPRTEEMRLVSKLTDTKPPSLDPTISAPPPNAYKPEVNQRESITRKHTKSRLIVGVAAFLVAVISFIIFVNRTRWWGKSNSTARQSQINTNATNNTTTAIDETSSNTQPTPPPGSSPAVATPNSAESALRLPQASPIIQSTSSPASTPFAVKKLDVTGIWSGRYFRAPAAIIINSQGGESFSGTLSCAGFLVTISGSINQDTKHVTLKETKFIKTAKAKYDTWFLGTNYGLISNDGKTMSGTGKGRGSYSWVFSKR